MEVSKLVRIDFDHISNAEIEKMSVKEILNPDTYENNEPKESGLLDPSLGTTNVETICSYCNSNSIDCEGHWGHINLGRHQFHYGFVNHVINILSCICLDTCKLLIPRNKIPKSLLNKKKRTRVKEFKKMCHSIKYSPYTGYPIPKISFVVNKNMKNASALNIVCTYSLSTKNDTETNLINNIKENSNNVIYESEDKTIKRILDPEECYHILQCIDPQDCNIIGYSNHVKDMIYKIYPIPLWRSDHLCA